MTRLTAYYLGTASYIVSIVLVNFSFAYIPNFHVLGFELSPLDPLVGLIYILRDFAQRELSHYVFAAMFIGAVLSYYLATAEIALASVSGFIAGELIDWAVFSFTGKPLEQRLLWSASLSAPVDSLVFLAVLGRLNGLAWLVMTIGKFLGVWLIYWCYRRFSVQMLEN